MSNDIIAGMKTVEARLGSIETKIDNLATVANKFVGVINRKFDETNERFEKSDKVINSLRNMTATAFADMAKRTLTIEDMATLASKDDLSKLKGDLEVKIDQTLGFVRKDYDPLASRVRDLEDATRKVGILPDPVGT